VKGMTGAKAVGVTAAFTALASILNLIKIPTVYLPAYSYQLGDIILVIAFFLFGLKIGLATATLNMVISIILTPGTLGFIGAPYYLISVFTMVLGSYVSLKIIKMRNLNGRFSETKSATYATLFSVLTRTLIMLPLDFFVFGFLISFISPLSVADSFTLVKATMPLIILYNITVPLYVIPTSYYLAKHIPTRLDSKLFENSIV
jgi:riboflavin transporter FmnP